MLYEERTLCRIDIRIFNKNNSYEEVYETYNKERNRLYIERNLRVSSDFEEYTRFDIENYLYLDQFMALYL
jgi:hypothetical protein